MNGKNNNLELVQTYPLSPSNLFEFPQLPGEEYTVKLVTSLSANQYDYELFSEKINLKQKQDKNRFFVPIAFDARLKVVPNEVSNVSFYPLLLLTACFLSFWYRKFLLNFFSKKAISTPSSASSWLANTAVGRNSKQSGKK